MMGWFFLLLTAGQIVCLGLALRHYQKTRSRYELLAVVVFTGLVYDNLILALGGFMGASEELKALNAPRFVIHGLATPLLMIWGFGLARRAGMAWAQSRRNHAIMCGAASLLIAMGVYSDVLMLNLQLRVEQGITRYVNIGGIKGPPIPSIITIIVLLVIGIMLWRRGKSRGLAVGSGVMFVGAMAGTALLGLGNAAEIAMSAGVLSGQQVKSQQSS